METNINYTLVGAFVITLVTAIVLAIIWLSSGFSFEKYSTYIVYMQESVSGLNIDAPVEYNGVSVGTVRQIDLNHKNPELVEVLLSIKSNTPITRGTEATLTTRGITGITYIALKDKSTDLRPLVALPGQPYPVIKSSPSLFMRLDAALSQLSNNFNKISESLQSVLDKENVASIHQTLQNIERVTGTLAANSKKMDVILENASKASQQFGPLIQSSTTTMRMLESQTLPAMYRLLSNLDDVTRTLSQVSTELKQNPSILIRGSSKPVLGPGEKR